MAAISTPYSRQLAAQSRPTAAERAREDQIYRDRVLARQLQDQEEDLVIASALRVLEESRHTDSPPFVPPVVPSDNNDDEEIIQDAFAARPTAPTFRSRPARTFDRNGARSSNAPVVPGPPVLDRNGAYTPEPYQARPLNRNSAFPHSATAPVSAPVVPGPPVLDRNGAYIPESYQARPLNRNSVYPRGSADAPFSGPRPLVFDRNGARPPEPHQSRSTPWQSAPVIPPVVPSPPTGNTNNARAPEPRHQFNGPVIPPTPPQTGARNRNVTFAPDPYRPPQPPQHRPTQTTAPFIPPAPVFASSRRAATPVPSRPTYWYPPGIVAPHMRARTPGPMMRPMYYHPPGAVIPAPPIPPIYRPPRPSVIYPPPPQKTEEVIVPFIPPDLDEKPSPKAKPRPILKTKPPVKPTKADVSSEKDDTKGRSRNKTEPVKSRSEPKVKVVERTKSSESESKIIAEVDNDVDLQSGPLHDLRKHVSMLTGSFKCTTCAAEVQPTPIHKDLNTSSSRLPSLDSHLHLTCSACSTMYCRGCRRTPHCKRTCNAGPDDKCFLKTCCRAGRAIAIFAILSCFDAHFLAMVRVSRRPTYFGYIKQTLSSSSSPLSDLILETIRSLLAWLPVDPIHSKSPPHVHESVKPLFQVSLLLEVIRFYLRAPREAWIRPRNGIVYKQILELLSRLEEVGKGALAGLVLARWKGSERTKGVGRVVWALAERVNEKNKGDGKKKELGWTAGDEHESFSKILSEKRLGQDLQDLKDKIREDQEEKKALLDHFLGQLLRWNYAEALK